MVGNIILIAMGIVVIALIVFRAVQSYRNSPSGAGVLAAFENSATIAWSRVMMICGAGFSVVQQAADVAATPEVAAVIKSVLPPQYMTVFLIGNAIITEMARRRTM